MGLFDEDGGGLSSAVSGINVSATLSGETDLLGSIGDAVTKFVPLTALSAANSFYNTGVAFANFFGADLPAAKASEELKSLGWDSYENYYDKHQQGIEAAGLIAGSFIPGLGAIKAVKALQGGYLGTTLARATNLLMPATEDVIASTKATILQGNSALFPSLASDKWRAIGLGARDQLVQNIAFETAVAATMNQSPLLTDQSWSDIAVDSLYGIGFSTAIGGLIEGYSVYSKFNKAYVDASKEIRDSRGTTLFFDNNKAALNGAPLAGDKVVGIFSNIWDGLPVVADNNLSKRTATATERRQINDAYTAMREGLAGSGNEEFADAVTEMILRGKNNGMTKDEMAAKLGQLKYIQPLGDDSVGVPTADSFFVHQFAKGTGPLGWTDLLTTAPVKGADITRRYTMREFATGGPKLGTFDQQFVGPNGQLTPLYTKAEDAWNDGVDLYLNRAGKISVNPSAPNIKEIPLEEYSRILTNKEARTFSAFGVLPKDAAPLFSAPMILDVRSGNYVNDAVRSLGDYAGPSAVKVRNAGVDYGANEFSHQTATTPLDANTATPDAMARYLWWDRRGIQRGDVIADGNPLGSTADLPALEKMFYESKAATSEAQYFAELGAKGVTFESGAPLPASSQQLLNKIQMAKDDFIKDVMANNPKMGAEEVARRANVSPDYIASGFQTSNPMDFMSNIKDISSINYVKTSYDVGNTSRINGNLVMGMQATQYRIQLYKDAANSALAKYIGPQWENFIMTYGSKDASLAGVRPGFLTFSNADYGTAENRAEFMGRNVNQFAQKTNDADQRTLSPHLTNLRGNNEAAAELAATIAIRHMTAENYAFLHPTLAAKYMPDAADPNNIMVLRKSLTLDKRGNVIDWNPNYQPQGFYPGATKATMDAAKLLPTGGMPAGLRTFYELHPIVADFERAWQGINDRNIQFRNAWYAAQGLDRQLQVGNLYAPAIDTGKYPYIAIVKPKAGSAFADGSTAVVTAATQEGLETKVGVLKDDFDVFYKNDIKDYAQIQGDYDYSRNFNSGLVNMEMQRRGVLNDVFPNVNVEATVKDYVDFNRRQNYSLIRDHVELGSDQFFTELESIGKAYSSPAESKVRYWPNRFDLPADNPYATYYKTALAIRQDENYTLWRNSQERLESYASSAFNTAVSAFRSVQKGLLSYEEASAMNERMGLGNPFGKAVNAIQAYQDIANQLPPTRVLSRFVNAVNSIQAATAIRLDVMQSLINAVSAPIMQLTEMYNIRKAMAINLPGTNGAIQLPSVTKVFAQAIGDYFNPQMRSEWMPWLKENGIIREYVGDYFKLQDASALPFGRNATVAAVEDKIVAATNLASKLTGSQLSEDFVRYIAAMSAKRMFEAAGVTGSDLLDNITTFVNRIHGNYVASQRPIAFQGPVGAAMSLFQTYQLNVFQQLFRYVGDGQKQTLAVFAALQGGLFGVQGLPGVQYVNQHLIGNAAMNPAHKDIYSTTMNAFDKELGDWLLYGAVSNVSQMGLYSRGDINPRSLTVLPINPMEFPAVSGGINFLKSLYGVTQRLTNGADVWTTITQGLEHNGLSRPLSGLGQLMQGYATTGQGAMISLVNPSVGDGIGGWSDLQSAANFGRLFGARPLDEAVVMDTLFRSAAYTAKDRTRTEALGSAFKTWAVGNKSIPDGVVNNFATEYAAAGGQMQNFAKFIIEQTKAANTARGNEIFQHLAKPLAQQMQMSIGGVRLPDYYTTPSTTTADTSTANVGLPQ